MWWIVSTFWDVVPVNDSNVFVLFTIEDNKQNRLIMFCIDDIIEMPDGDVSTEVAMFRRFENVMKKGESISWDMGDIVCSFSDGIVSYLDKDGSKGMIKKSQYVGKLSSDTPGVLNDRIDEMMDKYDVEIKKIKHDIARILTELKMPPSKIKDKII